MNCQYCNNPVPANATTCPGCGAQVAQQPQQQAPQQPQVVIMQQAAPQSPPKSRIAYQLLALFLGGLGIHNFYAGRTGVAVVQLLITLALGWTGIAYGIVCLWVLIEIFSVKVDGKGVQMK